MKNFDESNEIVIAINQWITHYEELIKELPTHLESYKKINHTINHLGIINNPFAKPYFHKDIRKKDISDNENSK